MLIAVLSAAVTAVALSSQITAAPSYRGGEDHPRRAEVIAYAKHLDVRLLDQACAPGESLEDYLTRVLPTDMTLQWASSDCDLKPPRFPRQPDHPLCATVHGHRGQQELRIHVRVGTHGTPIAGTPGLLDAWVYTQPPPEHPDLTQPVAHVSLSAIAGAVK